jgi:pilus assembly protein Flp/PilA
MGMWKQLGKLSRNQRGATAVEYGLILALIVLMIIGALSLFASKTINMWNNVAEQVVKA